MTGAISRLCRLVLRRCKRSYDLPGFWGDKLYIFIEIVNSACCA